MNLQPRSDLWRPDRGEGLRRIAGFAPRMGAVYAGGRNADLGPDRREAVSVLSPYLRRRLVTEEEVLRAAFASHPAPEVEKFVQEVVWRGYYKGWLERRPGLWADARDGAEADLAALGPAGAEQLAQAEAGRTGIAPFDLWAAELAQTGWLHNHARMWFASIWIFTLRLPWRLGADFFLRHLVDGDPASNTLGWRWVAGLHTQGKVYAARSENIEGLTGGRFGPVPGLARDPAPAGGAPNPAPSPPRAARIGGGGPAVALLTEDDLRLEELIGDAEIVGVATLLLSARRSRRTVAGGAARFDRLALADGAARMRAAAGADAMQVFEDASGEAVAAWARDLGARRVILPFAPVGWTRDWADAAAGDLAKAGAPLHELRRRWDEVLAPHATAGFFRVKAKIPEILAQLDL